MLRKACPVCSLFQEKKLIVFFFTGIFGLILKRGMGITFLKMN